MRDGIKWLIVGLLVIMLSMILYPIVMGWFVMM